MDTLVNECIDNCDWINVVKGRSEGYWKFVVLQYDLMQHNKNSSESFWWRISFHCLSSDTTPTPKGPCNIGPPTNRYPRNKQAISQIQDAIYILLKVPHERKMNECSNSLTPFALAGSSTVLLFLTLSKAKLCEAARQRPCFDSFRFSRKWPIAIFDR